MKNYLLGCVLGLVAGLTIGSTVTHNMADRVIERMAANDQTTSDLIERMTANDRTIRDLADKITEKAKEWKQRAESCEAAANAAGAQQILQQMEQIKTAAAQHAELEEKCPAALDAVRPWLPCSLRSVPKARAMMETPQDKKWLYWIDRADQILKDRQPLGFKIVGVAMLRDDGMMATYWRDATPDDLIKQYYASIAAGNVPEKFK